MKTIISFFIGFFVVGFACPTCATRNIIFINSENGKVESVSFGPSKGQEEQKVQKTISGASCTVTAHWEFRDATIHCGDKEWRATLVRLDEYHAELGMLLFKNSPEERGRDLVKMIKWVSQMPVPK